MTITTANLILILITLFASLLAQRFFQEEIEHRIFKRNQKGEKLTRGDEIISALIGSVGAIFFAFILLLLINYFTINQYNYEIFKF